MARLARGTSFAFAAALLIQVACSSQTNPPLLPDCVDPAVCKAGVASPSPLGQTLPTPDAGPGFEAGVGPGPLPEAGIQQGTLPEAGAGPGLGTGSSGTRGTGPGGTDMGPVCPGLAPTNGAPCDPVANSLPCTYSRLTCFCTSDWTCF
jgi:hypothetical protein